ncbi:hypothetical protein [Larkinella punicea]|uniref:hypothetical protein n=1 Tax=Larkinella punicea TaxID=2315727 RepID=UPI001E3D8AE3|nr:hypothetical protein [Larkinella punicea]
MVNPLPAVLFGPDQLTVPPSQPETVIETEGVFWRTGWEIPADSASVGADMLLLPRSLLQKAVKLPLPGRPGLL